MGGQGRLSWAGLAAAACGLAPIAAFCFHLFGLGGLRALAVALVGPALLALGLLALAQPSQRPLWGWAWVAGLLATLPYDAFRLGLVGLGWLGPDPIPRIGVALGLSPDWLWGYLWRFLGNGGGMGLAFGALGGRGPVQGACWGTGICLALLATLAWSPHGQAVLFPLSPGTALAAWVGHLIYGSSLGQLLAKAGPSAPEARDEAGQLGVPSSQAPEAP